MIATRNDLMVVILVLGSMLIIIWGHIVTSLREMDRKIERYTDAFLDGSEPVERSAPEERRTIEVHPALQQRRNPRS